MSASQCKTKKRVSLQDLNTMAVPALAAEYIAVESADVLVPAIEYTEKYSIPFMVLGEGSNTIFEKDFHGLVLRMCIKGIETVSQDSESVRIRVGAGESWHQLVRHTVEKNWYGFQNLALIPGTVGAAPVQNIGAYGVELSSTVVAVELFDVQKKTLDWISNQECEFGYRDSRFKHDWANKKIITRVEFQLSKVPLFSLDYPQLKQNLGAHPTLKQVFDTVVSIRSAKLPDPKKLPNSGSFFKNPVVSKSQYSELLVQYPELVSFKQGNDYKLAAAWLIDQAGWKQREYDGVRVHDKQALVIINPHKKAGRSILKLARLIKEDVFNRYGITLEIEPKVIS